MEKSRRGFIGLVLASAPAISMGMTPSVASAAAGRIPRVKATRINADGVTGITDASYDHLFREGDAKKGVTALITAGAVKINDVPVPTVNGDGEYGADRLDVNGGSGLWENADGTWSYNVQVLLQGSNETYDAAVVDFVDAVTLMRGISYRLTLTDGVVTAIDATVKDVAFANTVSRGRDVTAFSIVGRGDGSTDKPNPSTISFPNRNVHGRPQSQNMVLYWKDARGWHLEHAAGRHVVLDVNVDSSGNTTESVDGAALTDSRLTLQYSEPWNRPTQPFRAMYWMGENNVSAIQWFATPGVTVGFSRGASARPALASAVAKAENALDTVAVSGTGDGSDVTEGRMWVTQAYHDIFARAVADARAGLGNGRATNDEYEGALYRLAQAYGGRTGDRFSWLENRYFGSGDDYGFGTPFDTGYNGTGFWTFAQANLGTGTPDH
ncbi:hypothetical protein [Streptomyces arenae]|uniref:hypothetical protein n=1 Tax=Streptomyces arenae TaxID=29301 RepID=UPI0026585B68|nr:hypothetical protein [Streptomyces arenae]MCG7208556.1 hypothetical protein [Streptomyces arenae]